MHATTAYPTPIRTLACIAPGERVSLQRIVFDVVRERCALAGLDEGAVVACIAEAGAHLLLETPSRRAVAFERAWARFVQVGDVAELGAAAV